MASVVGALVAGALFRWPPDPRQAVALWVLCAAPLWGLVAVPWAAHRLPQIGLMLAGLGLGLGGVHLSGPWVVAQFAMPDHQLDLDHRPKPAPGRRNLDGVAPDVPPEDYAADDFVLLVLGDSFTEGVQLEDPQAAFAFVAQRALQAARPGQRIRVANFGYTSSSPVLQARQLRAFGAKYRPDLVLQCFDMSDFNDDLRYGRLLAEDGADLTLRLSIWQVLPVWAAWSIGVADVPTWLRYQRRGADQAPAPATGPPGSDRLPPRFFSMKQPLDQSLAHMMPSWGHIGFTRELAADLGAAYALVVLPRYQQFAPEAAPRDWERPTMVGADGAHATEPFRFLAQQAQRDGVRAISLLPAFQAHGSAASVLADDPHYTADGHHIAGTALAQALLEGGLIPD